MSPKWWIFSIRIIYSWGQYQYLAVPICMKNIFFKIINLWLNLVSISMWAFAIDFDDKNTNFVCQLIQVLLKIYFIIRSIIKNYIYYDYYWRFPGGSDGKESSCNMGDLSSVPGLGRSPGKGNSSPLQYSGLESPHEQKSRWATVHWVTKSWTWLSDFHFMIIIIFWISSMRNCEKLFSVLLYTYIILVLSLGLQSWPFTEKKNCFDPVLERLTTIAWDVWK